MNMTLPSDIVIKLVLAVLIGGAIGAEREYRSKSAGFRTLTLICLGSTILTIFSVIIGTPGNPDRIASNIATGIGFVGAGVIFKGDGSGSKVSGITTAAMIWVTAGLGGLPAHLHLRGRPHPAGIVSFYAAGIRDRSDQPDPDL